ncbi:NB-ARC domain-containing protein [Nocardia sp. NPDC051750]|uniref:NB-ARC domain-containing protein n=1 Tax=Nocardia sp. NPDC051750 TaxID=3364325 RepID=UPI0037AA0A14
MGTAVGIGDVRMSRARLYVLIDGFEHDMRKVIETTLLADYSERELLTESEFIEAVNRQDRDENSDAASLIHYMDLRATYDLLLRNKDELPYALTTELAKNAPRIQSLVPIRHRVMHGRPLNADDLLQAVSILDEFQTRYWHNVKTTLTRLRKDPAWEPYFERLSPSDEKIVHNLPEVDYDETTFIGRKDEAEKLLRDLKRRRDAVITIIGEGGIGKTALALDIAYKLLDSDDNPYEAILWVSLKTERLTAHGVEAIRGAIDAVPESVVEIGRGISGDFSGSLGDLAFALDGIQCLIIIDNLETVRGDEVVEMYDRLPTTVNYLFTSRVGIGQIERTFKLPPLSEKESKLLLRKFASARGQKSLLRMSDKDLGETVRKLRFSPLAIRWYVLSAESGRVPLDVVTDQGQLLDFCVRNVYERLSDESHVILNILRTLDRAIGFAEFSVLTNFAIDDLRRATQELNRGSLVSIEADSNGAAAGKLVLTETARIFLPRPDLQGRFISEILRREQELRESARVGIGGRIDRIDTTRVLARDENDRSAVFLLNRALRLAKSGQYALAHDNIERAEAFAPEYSEVHRVSGHVHKMEGNHGTAVEKFQHALGYASDDASVATTSFELANVLARQRLDAELAVPHARKAYDLVPSQPTALLLGRVLTWYGAFDEGQGYIEKALENASGRHKLIACSALVENWCKWADHAMKTADYQGAFEKAANGVQVGSVILREFSDDSKLYERVAECAILLTQSSSTLARRGIGHPEMASQTFKSVYKFVEEGGSRIPFRKRRVLHDVLETAAALSNGGDEVGVFQARTIGALGKSMTIENTD